MITLDIDKNGFNEWFKYGLLHNNNNPATYVTGVYKLWFANGQPHRLDGPAFDYLNHSPVWYINGIQYKSEFEYWIAVQKYTNLN